MLNNAVVKLQRGSSVTDWDVKAGSDEDEEEFEVYDIVGVEKGY